MIIRTVSTEKYNISMSVIVDIGNQVITVEISYYDWVNNKGERFDFPASEFSDAIEQFNRLEMFFKKRERVAAL